MGFIAAGFSNGAGMAEHVATERPVAGAILLSGALPLEMFGAQQWPRGVSAQIHYAVDDPFRRQEAIDALAASIRSANGGVEIFDYPCIGHLFTDPTLPEEFYRDSAETLWARVLDFCGSRGR
jgi:dienelactone hydrolase